MGYIYVAETSTSRLRAKTTGVAIFGIQGMATVYVYIAPIMLNSPALGMSNTGMNLTTSISAYANLLSYKYSSGWALEPSSTSLHGFWYPRPRVALSPSWTNCSNAGSRLGNFPRPRLKSLACAMTTMLARMTRPSRSKGSNRSVHSAQRVQWGAVWPRNK